MAVKGYQAAEGIHCAAGVARSAYLQALIDAAAELLLWFSSLVRSVAGAEERGRSAGGNSGGGGATAASTHFSCIFARICPQVPHAAHVMMFVAMLWDGAGVGQNK